MDQMAPNAGSETSRPALLLRRIRAADVAQVVTLDARITGLAKPDYWQNIFERYGERRSKERFFLIAEHREGAAEGLLGYIVGEIRAWEFGSEPCGWVLALSVDPDSRLHGIGHAMFEALSVEIKQAGVAKMRTMVARDNSLHLRFFRGEGMMAGPYIQLEKELE